MSRLTTEAVIGSSVRALVLRGYTIEVKRVGPRLFKCAAWDKRLECVAYALDNSIPRVVRRVDIKLTGCRGDR